MKHGVYIFKILLLLLILIQVCNNQTHAQITYQPFLPPKSTTMDFKRLGHKVNLSGIIRSKPSLPGNAADFYMLAIKGYDKNKMILGYQNSNEILNPDYPDLTYIISGSRFKECHFSPKYYYADTTGIVPMLDMGIMIRLSKAIILQGKRYENMGNYQKAHELYESVYWFGAHLESEQISFTQTFEGWEIQNRAVGSLHDLLIKLSQPQSANKCMAFIAEMKDIKRKARMRPLTLFNVWDMKNKVGPYNEDSVYLTCQYALYDENPMFRRQCILVLGQLYSFLREIESSPNWKKSGNRFSKSIELEIILNSLSQNDFDKTIRETAKYALQIDFKEFRKNFK